MKIGKLPKQSGEANVGKWYIGVEVMKHSPAYFYEGFAFRPYFVFMFTKIIDWGTEHQVIGGTKQKKIGGWLRWECPIGINIKLI